MCVVSMIYDHYKDKWGWKYLGVPFAPMPPAPSPEEINEFRELLRRAREYDKRNHEPDCGTADKREALKKLAELWKIDISFIDEEAK